MTAASVTPIYVEEQDDWLVQKAATLLQDDIERVTGKRPAIIHQLDAVQDSRLLVIGSVAGCRLVQDLARQKKLQAAQLNGQWEAYTQQIIPLNNQIREALVVAGSDRRGTAYGVFDISAKIGVSPWYWWADVPVIRQQQLAVAIANKHLDQPAVKYRGIFLNDEAPALSGWAREKFGGFNHLFYERVFELLLRLKGNYLWPAMWGNAFNADDTLNPVLASQWGIVMGTSHHEPMLRAQQEWKKFGQGAWDYTTNADTLEAFWRKGIENRGNHESIVTIGMRGDGDMPMTQGTATALLEKIVAGQRNILQQVTGKPAAQTPQLWALYKEVQDYYDAGMRVPDDVTLLLCDDNWGNIRRLPKLTEAKRAGGYGIYYHFDYVGGPRNYKWLNTNNIARVWEQMNLAYAHGVDRIWIVNVGDLKPMEFPISFFLDHAWHADQWRIRDMNAYYTRWAQQQFGNTQAPTIGKILQQYMQYNARRKPELLDARTYSAEYDNELQRVTQAWDTLLQQAVATGNRLPAACHNAYYQLVLHPVKACANLQHLYTAVALNQQLARQKNRQANRYADEAKEFYRQDSLITLEYHTLAGGKWNHMMSQTHIGYTYWQEPRRQQMPAVTYITATETATTPATVKIDSTIRYPVPAGTTGSVFYEQDGCVSIMAAHYTQKKEMQGITWQTIPGIGREGDGLTTFPVTAAATTGTAMPFVSYTFYCYDTGTVQLQVQCSPTLNLYNDSTGLQYAVAVDEAAPQVISLNKDDRDGRQWNQWVAGNHIMRISTHHIARKGKHTLRFYRISPAVVLQKLILNFGGYRKTYLGPQETIIKTNL